MEVSRLIHFGRKQNPVNKHLAAIEGGPATPIVYTINDRFEVQRHRIPKGTRTQPDHSHSHDGDVLILDGKAIPIRAVYGREKDAIAVAAKQKAAMLYEKAKL